MFCLLESTVNLYFYMIVNLYMFFMYQIASRVLYMNLLLHI